MMTSFDGIKREGESGVGRETEADTEVEREEQVYCPPLTGSVAGL